MQKRIETIASIGAVFVAACAGLAQSTAPPTQETIASRGTDPFFFGLHHTPLGQAQLTDDGTGRLVISNLGSSGKDGVSINIGDGGTCDYWVGRFDPGPVPPGGWIQFAPTDGTGNPLYFLRNNSINQQNWLLQMFPGAVPPPQSLTVEARLGGVPVDTQTFSGPGIPLDLAIMPIDGCRVDPIWPMEPDIFALFEFADPGPVQLTGGQVVLADEVIIIMEGIFPPPPPMACMVLQASNVPQIVFFDEQLGFQGVEHSALGQAHMSASGGTLTVSNIGSSGLDGVRQELPPQVQNWRTELQPFDVGPPGSQFRVSARGTLGGGPPQPLGHARLREQNGQVIGSADYSPIGATPTVRVEVVDDGNVVQSVDLPGSGGDLFVINSPGGVPIIGCGKGLPDPPCFFLEFPFDVPIELAGLPPALGDSVRILSPGTTTPIELISMNLVGSGGPIVILGTGEQDPEVEPILAFGLPHRALGEAQLDASGGTLTVSNIGSSGQDGVCIDLGIGNCEYWIGQFVPLMPAGSSLEFGPADDTGARFYTLRSTAGPTGIQQELQFEALPPPDKILIEARLDGVVVDIYCPPTAVTLADLGIVQIEGCLIDPFWPMDGGEIWALVDFGSTAPYEFPDGRTVLADSYVVRLIGNPTAPPPMSAVQMTGRDIPQVVFGDEQFGFDRLAHRALGQATMAGNGDRLTVSNIGSSGKDGVSIDLGETVSGFSADIAPFDLSVPGTSIQVAAFGSFGGGTGSGLGTASCSNVGGQVTAFADFSPLGSNTVLIEVRNATGVVGRALVPGGGAVGRVDPGPIGPGRIIGCGKLPPDPPCFVIRVDVPILFTPIGSTQGLLGTEIRLLAGNASGPIDSLSRFDILSTNSPFDILDHGFHLPPCVADLAPPFGVLDFFDVLEFLSLFDAQDPAADLAAPYLVWDFFDVLEFLNQFEQGCPAQAQCQDDCADDCDDGDEYETDRSVTEDLHVWDAMCEDTGNKVENVGDLIDLICAEFKATGRQISVFVDGHGAPGVMSAGAGTTNGTDGADRTATCLTSTNAAWFKDQVKDKVTTITLFGCSTGKGQAGCDFLDAMSDADMTAKAYDQTVCTVGGVEGEHRPTDGSTLKCGE